jgi:phosphatidylglycerophosphate synthase
VAGVLHSLSGGRLHPDVVTIIGLFMHAPIGWLIAVEHNMWAALLLVVFGLFDTLDGELARLQHRASNAGMLLDASTDRFKEVIIYCGVAYALIGSARPHAAVWAVAACGASLCVSYVKAKGELAVKDSGLSTSQINRLFQDGLLRFEVRMGLLVIGLVADRLLEATVLVAVMSSLTAIQRLVTISRKIS